MLFHSANDDCLQQTHDICVTGGVRNVPSACVILRFIRGKNQNLLLPVPFLPISFCHFSSSGTGTGSSFELIRLTRLRLESVY